MIFRRLSQEVFCDVQIICTLHKSLLACGRKSLLYISTRSGTSELKAVKGLRVLIQESHRVLSPEAELAVSTAPATTRHHQGNIKAPVPGPCQGSLSDAMGVQALKHHSPTQQPQPANTGIPPGHTRGAAAKEGQRPSPPALEYIP